MVVDRLRGILPKDAYYILNMNWHCQRVILVQVCVSNQNCNSDKRMIHTIKSVYCLFSVYRRLQSKKSCINGDSEIRSNCLAMIPTIFTKKQWRFSCIVLKASNDASGLFNSRSFGQTKTPCPCAIGKGGPRAGVTNPPKLQREHHLNQGPSFSGSRIPAVNLPGCKPYKLMVENHCSPATCCFKVVNLITALHRLASISLASRKAGPAWWSVFGGWCWIVVVED